MPRLGIIMLCDTKPMCIYMVVVCVIVCWDTCCINAHQVLMVIGNGFIKFGSRRGHYYQFNDRGTLG